MPGLSGSIIQPTLSKDFCCSCIYTAIVLLFMPAKMIICTLFRSLFVKNTVGQAQYKSLLSQLVQLIYDSDRPELVDIEFRSHGLKDFIKTGFG